MSIPSPELWASTEQALTRAERLLHHSLQRIEQEQAARRSERLAISRELGRNLETLQHLAKGLGALIQAMEGDRQDNRSRRWQGQLELLLTPLDSGMEHLREVITTLEQPLPLPLPHNQHQEENTPAPEQARQRLQDLLQRRRSQVVKLEAEVEDLRRRLFQINAPTDQTTQPAANAAAHQSGVPSIFS